MMTLDEKIREHRAIERAIKKWPVWLERLKNRKSEPLTAAEFCDRHGISPHNLSRFSNGRRHPKKSTFDTIQGAFRAEGFPV